ncbi:OmpA family protein [Ohtaekwangia sp.]|uniref:OmpA family protein n=1 Tax=Ohtaekwangia sp. TaxID=2066019 RepID=UPI002FDDEF47
MNRIAIVLLVFLSYAAMAQVQLSTKSKKAIEYYTQADNYRVRGQFAQAIELLNQAIDKDDKFVEAYYRLGLVYQNMKNYAEALKNYEKGLSLTTDLRKQKTFWYDMGEAYIATGEYEKAMRVLSLFVNNETLNKQKLERAASLFKSAEFAFNNKDNVSAFHQKPLSDTVNCFATQYFPVLTADQQQLIFTRRTSNDPNADEDIVISGKDAQGRWITPVSISRNINSRLNEGTCAISADGRKLIFTSCVGRDGIGSCDLYETRKIGEDWTVPKNLGPNVNSVAWESQPTLSADGRTLYFVSDRRSGLGRRDIWVTSLDENGKWTKAVNAGKPINSVFDEISPFIHVNNKTLYFASNGLPGFGGYDLFFVEKDSAGWSAPKNIGAPINNHDDQFSLFITADGKKGYYSHEENAAGGTRSRIFEMQIPEENQLKYRSNYVRGIVRDKQTRQVLSAKIELINISKNQIESLVESDSVTGEYLMVLTQGADYALYVNKEGYLFKSLHFNYTETFDFKPVVLDVDLEKASIGSRVVLNNIFFDVDKYELKSTSITELKKIIRFLTENPKVRVEIGGHTDNSGAAAYNRSLSEKRALAVYNYLVSNGVDKGRLTPKGYGPDLPIAPNNTEDSRQLNRRIEFKIIK